MALAVFLAILAIPLVILLWAVLIYNRLVRRKNLVEEGWSGIDAQLKRRANLIPNLVATVKGYTGHESSLLERVTQLRADSLTGGGIQHQGQVAGRLGGALANLFAVAEAYPDLKASENFRDLQDSLSEVEDHIQLSRRYYNGTVRELNILIESFPSNLIARPFGFLQAEFFELSDPADAAVPEVNFD